MAADALALESDSSVSLANLAQMRLQWPSLLVAFAESPKLRLSFQRYAAAVPGIIPLTASVVSPETLACLASTVQAASAWDPSLPVSIAVRVSPKLAGGSPRCAPAARE
eukprot:CAMPEP_0169085802 /NCGR_PEP_ID=MMETSP1015-20121227/13358_1 /TAXON_ID=342587 /ORGANISM="Karlodinium micrum, Strain CCMP2283" /LENGTH=108 /DNA_ID=CAMNT_0009145921 /DNA_START=243 /DNA_END=569 /DNA_ORIENTATION=-